ncbi:glucose 1-dehydrogenase/3-oxoacyl-[acyl-carrier protein] reductase [Arthrobacter sp. SLBN-100]|uniref:SDR family NAD(P)-dependent oxidoreductase n=1 Tax=Arthrobacter sp. SLBN-100 TaxID=2768450 RepID=UPI001154E046|nr:SDR family oxidoreductase [Arthrobacter sp. SLBN-100]TQJ62129.1 glucose 1-dehydrogenase/3-oxoacyl-[acyl-carrier protein] reductase [Arthrobacter sp. SLBN-100]
MARFENKTYMVVGGGSGMGQATVNRLASEGARVAVVDRDLAAAQATAGALGHTAIAIQADITDSDAVEGALGKIVEWSGRLDGAVNTAGLGFSALIRDQTAEEFQRVFSVNVFGMYNLVRAQAVFLADQGAGGAIVNFTSTNVEQPAELLSAYSASKAAVDVLTKVAAMEFAASGVRILGLGPALANTPMVAKFLSNERIRTAFVENILLGRPAEPEEVAAVCAFMLSDDASYLTGQTIYADGGSLLMRYPTSSERVIN